MDNNSSKQEPTVENSKTEAVTIDGYNDNRSKKQQAGKKPALVRKVSWTNETIDNELMNKFKSNDIVVAVNSNSCNQTEYHGNEEINNQNDDESHHDNPNETKNLPAF